jgi:hypothetical protein
MYRMGSNVHQRQVCIEKISPLQKELATAIERDRLETELSSTSLALKNIAVAKPANSDAAAIARYLEALGIQIGAQRLIDLINFLTVAAIEIAGGATLAIAQSQTVQSPNLISRENPSAPQRDDGTEWHIHQGSLPTELPTESNSVVSRNVARDGSKPGPSSPFSLCG